MLKLKRLIRKLYKLRIVIAISILALFSIKYSSRIFLPLKHIEFTGNVHITENDMDYLPKLETNTLGISLKFIHEKLLSHYWVKSAIVRRILPDRIKIEVQEHIPFAVWDKKFLIDKEGNIITTQLDKERLLSIIGENANLVAYQFIKNLEISQVTLNEISELKYVNKRRWDITFYKGLTVKLPEKNTKIIWLQALDIIKKNNLLKNNLSVLDMRIPDKFFYNHR